MAAEKCTFGKRRSRHHLFFPASAWRCIGSNALLLRGAFIVKIDDDLHVRLHRYLDSYMGDIITRDMLPRKKTIKHLKKEYKKNESKIRMMTPIEKLEWLRNEIDPEIKRNIWLFGMLDKQYEFFIAHKEEI